MDGRRELVHKKSLHHQLGKLASETVSVSRHTPLNYPTDPPDPDYLLVYHLF